MWMRGQRSIEDGWSVYIEGEERSGGGGLKHGLRTARSARMFCRVRQTNVNEAGMFPESNGELDAILSSRKPEKP